MHVRFQKKLLIWIGVPVLLILVTIIVLPLLLKVHSPEKGQYRAEKKRLSEIFTTLDTAYWRNKEKSLLLANEAILVSQTIADSNALAWALFNKARIFQKFEINDSTFNLNNQALAMAEKFHNDTLIAKIKNNIGSYYFYKDNYYLAMIYYTESQNIAIKIHDEYMVAKAATGLGLVYRELYDYKKAIEYYEKSIRIFEKLANKAYTYDYCSVLISIGVCYMYSSEYDKAVIYQQKALEESGPLHDSDMTYKIYGNLGAIEQYQGHGAFALDYFLKIMDYFSRGNRHTKQYVINLHNLGANYFVNKQYDKAEELLNQGVSISREMGFKSIEGGNIYLLSEVKKRQGQWQKAYEYYSQWQGINDSLLNLDTKKKISDYQWEMKSQKKKYEEELILKKYEIQKKRNLMSFIVIVSITIIALLLRRYMKKSIKLQKLENSRLHEKIDMIEKINELEKFKHQMELEFKNKELTTLSLQLVTKNETLSEISGMTNKLYKANLMDVMSFTNLKKIIKESLHTDKDWEQFKDMFEKVHRDFFVKLKQLSPELSENELRLCAYLKINLSNHEIVRILNISPGTLKTNRYRIRKKLNIDNKDVLEDYIRGI